MITAKANGGTVNLVESDQVSPAGIYTPDTVAAFVDQLIEQSKTKGMFFPVRIKFQQTTYAPPEIGANWCLGICCLQNQDRSFQEIGQLIVMNRDHLYFGSVQHQSDGDRIYWVKLV